MRCSVIVSDTNANLAGHFQNLVGQCPVTDCYFQHCYVFKIEQNIMSGKRVPDAEGDECRVGVSILTFNPSTKLIKLEI